MTTVNEAVRRVEVLLSQVAGENVQLYAEDKIIDMLQNSYNSLFDKLWWPNRMRRETKTLDGVSGEVTVVFTALTRFDDIKHVYAEGASIPLPELQLNRNPAVITGVTPRVYEYSATTGKFFKCYPITSVGNVIVQYREKQADFVDDPTVEIDFDVDLLVFAAVYDYLEDDGTNPGATEKYRSRLNAKFTAAKAKYGTRIIPYRRGSALIPDAWYTGG